MVRGRGVVAGGATEKAHRSSRAPGSASCAHGAKGVRAVGSYGSIDVTVLGDRVRLTLRGEIDAGLDADAQRALDSVGRTGTAVEVDARLVTFMDGHGLRLLSRLTGRAGRVVLLEPPQIIHFLLEVTGLLEDLRIENRPRRGPGGDHADGVLFPHLPPDQLTGARAGAPASVASPTTQRM